MADQQEKIAVRRRKGFGRIAVQLGCGPSALK
ncbi:hypothetical protein [Rhizobium ruizarguesonis]